MNKTLKAIRLKYPKSPFSRLKILEYSEYQRELSPKGPSVRGKSGGGILLGAGYDRWRKNENAVFPNFLSFMINIDMIFNDILYQVDLDFSSIKTLAPMINQDTLKKGAIISFSNTSFNIGKPFALGSLDYISPMAGIALVISGLETERNISFNIPFVVTGRLGIDYSHILGRFGTSYIGPAIRVSSGVLIGDFQKISTTLSNYRAFITVTLGILGFASEASSTGG